MRIRRLEKISGILAAIAWLAAPVGVLFGQQPVELPAETVGVHVGQSRLLSAPWPVKRLSVTDPKIADVEAITPDRIMLLGRQIGSTDVTMWNEREELRRVRIDVHVDLNRIKDELTQVFEDSNLDIMQSQDVVIVMGTLSSSTQKAQLIDFLNSSSKATGLEYVNMTKVEAQRLTVDPTVDAASDSAAELRLLQPVMLDDEGFLDPRMLRKELERLMTASELEVRVSEDVYVISGTLRRAEHAVQMRTYLDALGESTELKFVDLTTVAGIHQVMLQVRFAEAERAAVRALGFNILNTGTQDSVFFGASQPGSSSGGAFNPVQIGPPQGALAGPENTPFTFNQDVNVSPLTSVLLGFPRAELMFFIQALTENQYLRILAEPNLVALSGEEASFLAGGEFPIPVVQGSSGGSSSVTVQFKEFGIRLNFQPTVLGENTIRLHVAPEVSELSPIGSVEQQGFRIPGLLTRRAETTLEMKSGQTMVMAGLLSSNSRATSAGIPGISQVPILGSLFRSVRYEEGNTELMVMVQAWLVEPQSLAEIPPLPGDLHTAPNDWELYAMGQIEGQAPPKLSAVDAEWLRELGLDELRGPGAWARFEQAPATSQVPIEPMDLPGDLPADRGLMDAAPTGSN